MDTSCNRLFGIVYLIHFDDRLAHAQHYIGFTTLTVENRLNRHMTGQGAKLLRAVRQAGISYKVVRTWENVSQALERGLKNYKSAKHFCPICNPNCKDLRMEVNPA